MKTAEELAKQLSNLCNRKIGYGYTLPHPEDTLKGLFWLEQNITEREWTLEEEMLVKAFLHKIPEFILCDGYVLKLSVPMVWVGHTELINYWIEIL